MLTYVMKDGTRTTDYSSRPVADIAYAEGTAADFNALQHKDAEGNPVVYEPGRIYHKPWGAEFRVLAV